MLTLIRSGWFTLSVFCSLDAYPKSIELTILHRVEKKGNGKLEFKLFSELVDLSGGLGKENSFVQKITFKAERVTPEMFVKKDKD